MDGVVLRHRIAQGLPVPAVRRSSGRHGIVTSRWVPGTPLNEMPAPGRLQYRGETAELLARVHALPPGSAVVPVARAEQLTAAVQGLDAVAPRHSSAARRIAQQVGAILHAADLRVCHGDFSDDQIVVPDDGGELRLLDLDRLGLDDPHADLGSWFAAAAVAEGKAVDPGPLIEAYEAAGGRVDPHRLRLYCAGAVLQRATEPFRLRSTAWPEEIDRLMALAGELMEGKDW